MIRRIKSQKMTVSRGAGERSSISTTQFKSKLALALSNSVNGEGKEAVPRRGDYVLMEHLLDKHELPLTVNIKNFGKRNNNNTETQQRYNGISTIQTCRYSTTLQCVTATSGRELNIPISRESQSVVVNFLSIDNTALYRTLGEVRCKKRDQNILWFTSTKPFVNDKSTFHAGQIFSFAPAGLLSSFKRDRNIRGVTVFAYPSLRKYYLSLEAEGDFRKCDAPTTTQTIELSELLKSANFPFFINIPHTNSDSMGDLSNFTGRYFVKSKMEHTVLYISKKFRGSLQIHSFPVNRDLYAKVLTGRRPIDRLEKEEIDLMIRCFEGNSKRDANGYCFKTYNEVGIIRLLEEIFLELDQFKEEGVYTRLLTKKPINRKSIQKRVIKTYLRNNQQRKNADTASRYLQSVDGKSDSIFDDETKQNYVNESLFDGQMTEDNVKKRKTRELVVEFDDGGYVIIPFDGNSPKVSVGNDAQTLRRTDNLAYNYHQNSCDDDEDASDEDLESEVVYDKTCDEDDYHQMYDLTCDQHIYTYISCEELDKLSSGKQTNSDKTSPTGQPDERYSTVYDYSYAEHFTRATSPMGRSNIAQLSVEEVGNLLKVNLMKHHVSLFQEHQIDGEKLQALSERDFIEMNLTKFEARKLTSYLDGWRGKEGSATDHATWLSKLAKDWTVNDVIKYLQHINMISFQRFVQRHSIDGFLLKQILKDDVMESLNDEHSLVLRKTDILRLRNYVMEDEKPKFRFFDV
eukprot:TCONS_00003052-protein